MSSFTEFDPAAPLGPGRTVVEASAGTGKTFTISALVTRLVAEEGIPLEEILVVTFTRAATAELRARIRGRLVATRRALAGTGPADPDDHLSSLLGQEEPVRRRAADRLTAAITHFDRAQIFTIHGFAARLLAFLGLRSRLSPETEPGEVDAQLLAETAGDLIVGRFAGGSDGDPPTTAAVIELGRAVIDKPDARIVPSPEQVGGTVRARVELGRELRSELRRRMRRRGLATFDDGLAEVRDALTDAEVGAAARQMLSRRYSVALVDESQDTDPMQWEVIRSVFSEGRLVVIGDPKQSIYRFRGADVEAYLSAVQGAEGVATLPVNWRSDGPLVAALDALFTAATFGSEHIRYHRVRAAPGREAARIHGGGAPLTLRRLSSDLDLPRRRDGLFKVAEVRQVVAEDAAAEVVRVLRAGITVEGANGPEPLRPDHIAVLCRTRKQVDMVRAELDRRQVPSVAARTGGVFASAAAEEWRRFLHGVENPDRFDRVRLAAGSLLIGKTPQQIAAMADDEVLDLQRTMRLWHELLHGDGVPALVAAIDRSTGLAARVLALPDGERMMTDLTHIAEEMHGVWRRRRMGSLAGWLEAAMTEAEQRDAANVEEPESRQRRLETDAEAVQVQTVHAAKGLEWPVVLVPYAWDQPQINPRFPVFHAEKGQPPRPRLIDAGGEDGPDFATHCAAAVAEEAAEEGRLLYVALTRAEHKLVAWWVEHCYNTEASKLHELITEGGRGPEQLVASAGGTIAMPVLEDTPPVVPYQPEAAKPLTLDVARFGRRLDYLWRRASFTSLSPEHPIDTAVEIVEAAPRSDEVPVDIAADEEPVPAGESPLPMADLPRGARFGTLVHAVLEQVPFDAPDLEAAVADVLEDALRFSAWDFEPAVLVDGIVAAMSTPLGPEPDGVRLRDLDPARTFDELVFELPVRTHGGTVSLGDVGGVMLAHLPHSDPFRRYAATLHEMGEQRFCGFLTGAVDLTAAVPSSQGERYVVVDYKTNAMPRLGEVAAVRDYGPGPMAEAMIDGNYVLQATLYQVALHRYLQWRLAGYEPERHLGGARYLFVRGMVGAETPVVDGERCGVVRWRPPSAMIVGLSALFAGGES